MTETEEYGDNLLPWRLAYVVNASTVTFEQGKRSRPIAGWAIRIRKDRKVWVKVARFDVLLFKLQRPRRRGEP